MRAPAAPGRQRVDASVRRAEGPLLRVTPRKTGKTASPPGSFPGSGRRSRVAAGRPPEALSVPEPQAPEVARGKGPSALAGVAAGQKSRAPGCRRAGPPPVQHRNRSKTDWSEDSAWRTAGTELDPEQPRLAGGARNPDSGPPAEAPARVPAALPLDGYRSPGKRPGLPGFPRRTDRTSRE